MRQGTVISGSAHLIFMAAALISLPDRRVEATVTPAQVTDVSIVTLSDFQAARSAAPDEPQSPEMALSAPDEQVTDAATPQIELAPVTVDGPKPDTPDRGEAPDLSALDVVSPQVSIDVDRPLGELDAAPLGIETPLPDARAQDGSINSNNFALLAPETPNLAPRIDTSAAPKPVKPTPEAPVETPSVTPQAEPDAPLEVDPDEATAPKEATTEITPDAVLQDRPTTPRAAARPRGRPADLTAEAERKQEQADAIAAKLAAAVEAETKRLMDVAAQEEAKRLAEAEALEAAQAELLAEQTAAAQVPVQETSQTGAGLGQSFNSSEARAIGDVIGKSWNKTLIEGKDQYERLVVVVRVRMTADGKIMGSVEPVQPRSPNGDFKVAFEAARRAVLRAQPIPLPPEKFRDGDFLEIRFDPGRSAISLD